MKIKSLSLVCIFLFTVCISNAQIVRTSVVEHFTNTSCSVCAANNDGVYNAVNNNANTIHISFHPSSPYASDFFSQQNKAENDERTTFNGVFGSTPRIVLNGNAINLLTLNNALQATASAQTNFKLKVQQEQVSFNNFQVRVVVTKIADDVQTSATLFVGAMEDTIYQITNNGETVHYNVFRKALTAVSGNTINLPAQINDSVVVDYNYSSQPTWNQTRMHSIGILQKDNREVINSARSINKVSNATNIINSDSKECDLLLFPNPVAYGVLYSYTNLDLLTIYNSFGSVVKQIKNVGMYQAININELNSGIYFATVMTKNGHKTQKIIIK